MKRKKQILLSLLMVINILCAMAQGLLIKGKTNNTLFPVAKTVLAYTDSTGQWIRETVTVTNEQFTFHTTLYMPMRIYVTMIPDSTKQGFEKRKPTQFSFAAENNDICIDFSKPGQYLITGSMAHKDELLFKKITTEKSKQLGKSLSRSQYRQLVDSFITANPASLFSQILLAETVLVAKELGNLQELFDGLSLEAKSALSTTLLKRRLEGLAVIKPGTNAPGFTLKDQDEQPHSLADFKGTYVLLNFWTSWCPTCRREHPKLKEVWKDLKEKNIRFVSISLNEKEERKQWLEAISKDGLNWLQLHDTQGIQSKIASQYGVRSYPRNFLIDPFGTIIAMDLPMEHLQKKIEPYLK